MKRLIVVGVAAAVCLCTGVNAEMRIWTSKKGDTIEAEYVKMYGSKAVLKTPNGKALHVRVDGLCDDDQEYLSQLMAVPPRIEIEVDDDLERDKKADGYWREAEEQRIACNVTVKKMNREPCLGNYKAWLYLLGEEKGGTKKKILANKEQAFSFAQQDVAEFSLSATVKSREGYMWAEGFEYEGYLICVKDENGEIIAMESNINAYERHVDVILKSKPGNIFTEDFAKMN